MNYFYITGTSRGIGKALAERLLKDENNVITGISRHQGITSSKYHHVNLDLSDPKAFTEFQFQTFPESGENAAEKIVLINNAGTLGDIAHVGNQNDKSMVDAFLLNLVAPSVLINRFLKKYESHPGQKLIINISSGAGKYPVDGWSVYCSSKAGLDMFSEVTATEHMADNQVKVFSVAPGIVETLMQTEIRKQKKENFSRVEDFIAYKEKGELKDPVDVAEKLEEIIQHPENYKAVNFSLWDR